uniref:Uncharacterized protein n=2 Tax=Anopheles atroparvus TaxID=41427 RepID=A0A182JMZ1_ANOAO
MRLRILKTMKVALCLFAVLAVALARPQQNLGYAFWPETSQVAYQRGFILPQERLIGNLEVAPLVNLIENVPYNRPVSVAEIVNPIDEPAVYPTLQRSVDQVLTGL